jgi:hypothetical protein
VGVTHAVLSSNVVTLTSVGHGLVAGRSVTVALDPADPIFDGTYTIASVPDADTFTYAKTHANVAGADVEGTATLENLVSPVGAGTSEVVIVWPANAYRLSVYPASAAATLRLVSGGATLGTSTLPSGVWSVISGKAGDTTYVGRPSSTVLDYKFDTLD